MSLRPRFLSLAAVALAAALGFAAAPYAADMIQTPDAMPDWVARRPADIYAPQRVVYHLKDGGGLFNRHYKGVLKVAENHVAALAPGKVDLRVVMQGDGVDLLAWARRDEAARRAVDALKAKGVRFEVCRNTLLQRRINPDVRLHGVAREDVVTTAVGEIGALEQKGYVYIKL